MKQKIRDIVKDQWEYSKVFVWFALSLNFAVGMVLLFVWTAHVYAEFFTIPSVNWTNDVLFLALTSMAVYWFMGKFCFLMMRYSWRKFIKKAGQYKTKKQQKAFLEKLRRGINDDE